MMNDGFGLDLNKFSDHPLEQVVDEVFSVAPITTSLEGVSLLGESSSGASQLEWPQGVGGLLEVGANGVDLVNEVLHGDDSVLAEGSLHQLVVGQGDSLLVDLAVASLVDELLDGFSGRITELFSIYPKVM